MTKRPDPVTALLIEQQRQGLVDLARDDETGEVVGYLKPYTPLPPPQRGRGRYPAPHRFRSAGLRARFDELAADPRFHFREVQGKPNKAAIHRELAKESGLSVERIKKIVSGAAD